MEWRIKRHIKTCIGGDDIVSWRLAKYSTKEKIEKMWGQGYVDIKTVTDPQKGINYILGYITEEQKLTFWMPFLYPYAGCLENVAIAYRTQT
ncbi:MAG TPA: hypothetical protein HA348_07375 [Thermoplasmata archaeon]|nr:hypothetical protein [Thermoplasmata archaeon]